jgi:hypothetical protein
VLRSLAIGIATCACLALAACGGDDAAETTAGAPAETAATTPERAAGPETTASETAVVSAPAGDADRYCALARELDASGEKFFADLGEDATAAEYEAAERAFVEASQDTLEELRTVAPAEISADVPILLAALFQRAGLPADIAVDEAQSSAAEERIRAFEDANCAG